MTREERGTNGAIDGGVAATPAGGVGAADAATAEFRQVRLTLERTQRNLDRIRRTVARMQQAGRSTPSGGGWRAAPGAACEAEPRAIDFDAVSCPPTGALAAEKLRSCRRSAPGDVSGFCNRPVEFARQLGILGRAADGACGGAH